MKIRVAVTLDIDPQAWALTYGTEGVEAIRADVREWADNLLAEAARQNEVLL